MKRSVQCILVSVAALCFSQCSSGDLAPDVTKAMAQPQTAVLYSLNPQKAPDVPDTFHGYVIISDIPLDEKQTKTATAAINAVVPSQHPLFVQSSPDCFRPRHGYRVTESGHVYDLVICFECGWINEYEDDKLIGGVPIEGSPQTLNALLAPADPY